MRDTPAGTYSTDPAGKRLITSAAIVAVLLSSWIPAALVCAEDKPKETPKEAPKPPGTAAKTATPAANDPLANDPVERSIRAAVAFLYSQQNKDGNWEEAPRREGDDAASTVGAQFGGLTAMATYGLLAAGESPQDPRMQRAINWLMKNEIIGTYAMGMKLQIFNYMEHLTDEQKKILARDATLLMNAVKVVGVSPKDEKYGMFHYYLDPTKADYDHSTSNYGVLGMWAAAQRNLEVPTDFWRVVDAAWRRNQHKEGSWSYHKVPGEGHDASVSMTAAGVATLFITQDYITQAQQQQTGWECRGNLVDENIERGLGWLAAHYKDVFGAPWKLYALYNCERVGTASGLKYFGNVDWYEEGAKHLVKTQDKDGSWDGDRGKVVSTVYGVLFLNKGRAPIMFNKLEYTMSGASAGSGGHSASPAPAAPRGSGGSSASPAPEKPTTAAAAAAAPVGPAGNWNQRPRDVANLTRWTGRMLEKDLNWQIVNLHVGAADLHDAPVLYISGNQVLNFSREDKEKLKAYVEQGGLILGHADCNDGKFSNSFMRLGQEMFKGMEFRELPSDHPIYTCHFNRKNWRQVPPALKALGNGAREFMVLIAQGDPARFWQVQNFAASHTQAMAEMAANIFLYAADKQTLKGKYKGQSFIVKYNDKVKPAQAVKVARLEYRGTWDPEPGGWRRLSAMMHNTLGVDVVAQPVKLGDGKLKASDYPLAHLTGTEKFTLTPQQQKELKKYVEEGGTLVIDAAGGVVDFKESAEMQLANVFGAKSLPTLSADHAVYSAGGLKIDRVDYRSWARRLLVSGMNSPRLKGLEVKGRTAVFYSPEDLSVGLVGMPVEGIYGYEPDDATKLMRNVVVLAMGGKLPPPPAADKPAEQPKPADGKPDAGKKDMKEGEKGKENQKPDAKKAAEKKR
jgi:hypothetical protein